MEEELRALERIIDLVIDFFVKYSLQVLGAIIILLLGVVIAKWVANFLLKFFEKKNLDITLSKFLVNTIKLIIIGFTIIIAIGKFGITIAPFIAAIAAMAFGVSFAIQGPVANYGAGLVIILTRPFVVGNTITVAGVNGVVEEVKLGSTVLTDEDGVKITIPNKHITGEILQNSEQWKIVEEVVGISYSSNPEKAISIVKKSIDQFEEISKDPPPQVGIQNFADSSINIGYRCWVPTIKYFQTLYRINLAVYKQLIEQGVEIPFPQRDVHIVSLSGGDSLKTT